MELLTSQKNQIFDIIENYGLPVAKFDLQTGKSKFTGAYGTHLTVVDTNYFFSIENYENSSTQPYYVVYSPSNDMIRAEFYTKTWENTLHHFIQFIISLKREISIEDKWEKFRENIVEFHFTNNESSSEKFSYTEYEILAKQMGYFKNGISSLEIPSAHQKVLIEKIDYLTELAKDMNKFDWKNLFIGTIVNIVTQLAFTPENTMNLLNLLRNVFKGFFLF